jgi:hypothetical protein
MMSVDYQSSYRAYLRHSRSLSPTWECTLGMKDLGEWPKSTQKTCNYVQPCFQMTLFFKSCQFTEVARRLMTASKRQLTTTPSSSNSTSTTKKCFSLFLGSTAVHLLCSNFAGLIRFIHTPSRKTWLRPSRISLCSSSE